MKNHKSLKLYKHILYNHIIQYKNGYHPLQKKGRGYFKIQFILQRFNECYEK